MASLSQLPEQTSHPARQAPRRLAPRAAYPLSAAIIGLALFASGTPSALYDRYAQMWGFSTITLTLVYAVYALGVLTTLVLMGRLSDDVGRRPVLITALAILLGMTFVFMFAHSVVWLFVARAGQGLATGALMSAASASMLDLHPTRDAAGVSLANGVVSATGLGLGVLVASVLVQYAPAPLVLPYVLLTVLVAIALVGVVLMPEPVSDRTGLRLRVERPHVPRTIRAQFLLAALAVICSWSIGALFLSLGPQLTTRLFDSDNDVVAALPFAILAAAGALGQIAFRRAPAWSAAMLGAIALSVGVLLIVAAAGASSTGLLIAGAAVGGVGFGVAFMGGLRSLSAVIPGEHRAAVMSAFYVVAYLSLSVPAILAGLVVGPLGLNATFELFGSIAAAIALIVAASAWRMRQVPALIFGHGEQTAGSSVRST